jgi:hypothetical protein
MARDGWNSAEFRSPVCGVRDSCSNGGVVTAFGKQEEEERRRLVRSSSPVAVTGPTGVAESWPQATRRLRGHRPHGAMRSPQPGIRQGRFPASFTAPQAGRTAYSRTRLSFRTRRPPPHSPAVPLPHTARGTAPPRDGAPGAACESAAAHACAYGA